MEQKVQDIATVFPSLTYRIEPFTYTTPYEQLDQINEWTGFEVHPGLEKDYLATGIIQLLKIIQIKWIEHHKNVRYYY